MKNCLFILALLTLIIGLHSQQEPVIRDGEHFIYVSMEFTGPYAQFSQKLGEFMAEVQKQGIAPVGGPIGVYPSAPANSKPEELKWEIAMPVDPSAKAAPPLKKVEFNYAKTAELTHQGPYGNIGPVYAKLFQFIAEKNFTPCGPSFETYLDDPASVKPEDCRTLIVIPVESKEVKRDAKGNVIKK